MCGDLTEAKTVTFKIPFTLSMAKQQSGKQREREINTSNKTDNDKRKIM